MRSCRRSAEVLLGPLVALLWLAACDDSVDKPALRITATGVVGGVLAVDRNGNGVADSEDDAVEGWVFELREAGGGLLATDTTDEAGVYGFEDVPVGRLVVGLAGGNLGDTLDVVADETGEVFVLEPGDEAFFETLVSFPVVSVPEVRALGPGRRVFVTGVALNPFVPGVDEVHVLGGGRAIRVFATTRVSLAPGDSVRVLGTTARRATQPVLEDGDITVIEQLARRPEPVSVTAAEAADASGGELDAALATLADVEVVSYEGFPADSVTAVVEDESGTVGVVFRPVLGVDTALFGQGRPVFRTLTGLLLPAAGTGAGGWIVVPRTGADLDLEIEEPTDTTPELSVEEVRRQEPGRRVATFGIALNPLVVGVDELHLQGDSLALRMVRVERLGIQPGDSVRAVGTTAVENGQPLLTDVELSVERVLARRVDPVALTTAGADSAGGGGLDAALVQVNEAVVQSFEGFVSDSVSVIVDDGSGPLEVSIRPGIGLDTLALSSGTPVFTRLRGLLVSAPPREIDEDDPDAPDEPQPRWTLVPRNGTDIRLEIRPAPASASPRRPDRP